MDDSMQGNVLLAMRRIADSAERSRAKGTGDYINPEDGLLYCGKCKTKKERWLELPAADGKKEILKIPTMCKCGKEEAEAEERRIKQADDARTIIRLKAESLMDAKYKFQTFGSYLTTKDTERILKLCKRYVENFDEMFKKNQGLLFWGNVGTGKTFSAACIANELLNKKIPVIMTSFVKLLEHAQKFKPGDDGLFSRLNRAKLLIVDDLGAERGTDFALEKVYSIIDGRYRARLPMILTTNLDLNEMKRTTEIRYARIYDRIFEVCYPVRFVGKSFRREEASKRFTEMKKFLEG